jgi:hypothetical protein
LCLDHVADVEEREWYRGPGYSTDDEDPPVENEPNLDESDEPMEGN